MHVRTGFAAALVCLATHAAADVVDVGPSGFLIRHEVNVSAPPDKVYSALTGQIGSWWNPAHTYSGDAKNLSIEARPGGCFCERFPDGGGVGHMSVINVSPNRMLRLAGALGPLQQTGVAGSMTWKLTPAAGATAVELSYSVGGYMRGGLEKIAPGVNEVLGEQLGRLKAFVETGKPQAN